MTPVRVQRGKVSSLHDDDSIDRTKKPGLLG